MEQPHTSLIWLMKKNNKLNHLTNFFNFFVSAKFSIYSFKAYENHIFHLLKRLNDRLKKCMC